MWGGAAPAEIEREIVNRQEEELKGLDSLETMISNSQTGRARITLEFAIGTNMDRALLLVSNRLDRVTGYPEEANEPTLRTSGSDDNPIAWIILKRAQGNTAKEMAHFGPFAKDVIRERIERVDGVATVNVYGGVDRELQVLVDPEMLAKFRLTVPEVLNKLRRESVSVSAGNIDEGKRRYVVRVEGELDTLGAVRNVVLRSGASRSAETATGNTSNNINGGSARMGRVYVRDIAEVTFGYKEPAARIRHKGEAAIAINAVRETGANVISTMQGIKRAIAELRKGPLAEEKLTLTQSTTKPSTSMAP